VSSLVRPKLLSLLVILVLVLSSFAALKIVPVSGVSLPFSDGFESGSFSGWTGTSIGSGCNVSVQSSIVRTDSYAANVTSPAGNTKTMFYASFTGVGTVYARGFVRFPNLTALSVNDDRCALIWLSGGVDKGVLGIRNVSGVLRWYLSGWVGTTWTWYSNPTLTVAVDTWYCIEFKIAVGVGTGESRGWVDGSEFGALIGLNNTMDSATVGYARFGNYAPSLHGVFSTLWDDCKVQTSYIGTGGEEPPPTGTWVFVRDPAASLTEVRRVEFALGNQSVPYITLAPGDVVNYASISSYAGLILCTYGSSAYNQSAVFEFCKTKQVIVDVADAAELNNFDTPDLDLKLTSTTTFIADLGWFKNGDVVPFNGDGKTASVYLTCINITTLTGLGNVTVISRFDASWAHVWRETDGGSTSYEGLWVTDFTGFSSKTEWAGIWIFMDVLDRTASLKLGSAVKWMGDGTAHRSLAVWMTWWQDFYAAHPAWVFGWNKTGSSVDVRDINYTIIGNGSRYVFWSACIHGDEKLPAAGIARAAELVVADAEAGGYWSRRLQDITLIIIPIVNPDGYYNNTRDNKNGYNLNREFPPGGVTTQPEAWALRNLTDLYKPDIAFDLHEGGQYEPNDWVYPGQMSDSGLSVRTFTLAALAQAKAEFALLGHWGLYTDGGVSVDIGKIRNIEQSGITSMFVSWTAYTYQAMSSLYECIVSNSYAAREMCYATEYYTHALMYSTQHLAKNLNDSFAVYSSARIASLTWSAASNKTTVLLNSTGLTSTITGVDVGPRAKPLLVYVDSVNKTEGSGWSWSSSTGTVTIPNATNIIEISWVGEPPPPPPGDILTSPYVTVPLAAFVITGIGVIAYSGYRKLTKTKKREVS